MKIHSRIATGLYAFIIFFLIWIVCLIFKLDLNIILSKRNILLISLTAIPVYIFFEKHYQ